MRSISLNNKPLQCQIPTSFISKVRAITWWVFFHSAICTTLPLSLLDPTHDVLVALYYLRLLRPRIFHFVHHLNIPHQARKSTPDGSQVMLHCLYLSCLCRRSVRTHLSKPCKLARQRFLLLVSKRNMAIVRVIQRCRLLSPFLFSFRHIWIEDDAHTLGLYDVLLNDDIGGVVVADWLAPYTSSLIHPSLPNALDWNLGLWPFGCRWRHIRNGWATCK